MINEQTQKEKLLYSEYDLEHIDSRIDMVTRITHGEVVVFSYGNLFGIGCRADDPHAIGNLLAAKGESPRAIASMMEADVFYPMIDITKLEEPILSLVQNKPLYLKTNKFLHFRLPIQQKYVSILPSPIVSTEKASGTSYVQNIGPEGSRELSDVIARLSKKHIIFAVSSFNDGAIQEPEIISKTRSAALITERGIVKAQYIERSHGASVKIPTQGSFTICDHRGNIIRIGRNHPHVIELALGIVLATDTAKPHKYGQPNWDEVTALFTDDPIHNLDILEDHVFPTHT
jgi:hypothetical protein